MAKTNAKKGKNNSKSSSGSLTRKYERPDTSFLRAIIFGVVKSAFITVVLGILFKVYSSELIIIINTLKDADTLTIMYILFFAILMVSLVIEFGSVMIYGTKKSNK